MLTRNNNEKRRTMHHGDSIPTGTIKETYKRIRLADITCRKVEGNRMP